MIWVRSIATATSEHAPIDEYAFYRQLIAILAEKRQRNPAIKAGWVAHKFRDRVGRWPPYGWQGVDPLSPTLETRAWVRARDIAFAKAQHGGGR